MKRVIDIDEDLYKAIKNNDFNMYGGRIYEMIRNSKLFKQEPCEDAISRKSIKQKLQEHHDFFVNAYGGFSNLPLNDKSRVDEITNCISMVVNEPSITPQPVLDKIRAEIDREEKWLQQAGYNAYNVDIAFDAIKRTLNEGEGVFSDYPDMPYQFDNMTGSMNL